MLALVVAASAAPHQATTLAVSVLARVPWGSVLRWTGGAVASALVAGVISLRVLLERMYASVKPLPPTERQLEQEDAEANPLYRAVPALRGRLAWRQLGDFPTPVHRFSLSLPGGRCRAEFWVKREDLCSERYGGNKVRTLQYQLASFEAHAERLGRLGRTVRLLSLGTSGSNQVVATKTHAAFLPLPVGSVEGLYPKTDLPEMDNTLNFLSAASMPGKQGPFGGGGCRLLAALGVLPAGRSGDSAWVMMLGGNCPLGVLGQAGAALELGEQIASGRVPDPDGIVLAAGSNCTVTGLVFGVTLARAAGIQAFCRPGFRIYAQPVHPALAKLQRSVGFLTSRYWPMTVGRGLREIAGLLAANGGPDLKEEALRTMRELLVVSTDTSITGEYGAHSDASKAAKAAYDASALPPEGAPHLWLCGHFTAKSFALLLKLLEEAERAGQRRRFVFWQTKSAVQPRGAVDEWAAFQEQRDLDAALAKWAVVGGVTGHPSAVGAGGIAAAGKAERRVRGPEDYRALMTSVAVPA